MTHDNAIIGRFDIGGRSLFLDCRGSGTPTVIIERGTGGASTNDPSWDGVRDALISTMRFCLYDRANLGQSDPAPLPRTAEDVVADLHTLLQVAQIAPPYILVGHSLGGLFVRLYADRYPDEVAGIVLNDSMHPEGLEAELTVWGPPQPNEPAGVQERRAMLAAVANDTVDIPEPILQMPSVDQVRATRPLGNIPLVVLTGAHHPWPEDAPPELRKRLQQEWQRINDELLPLSTRSRRIIAANSGHFPQIDDMEVVIDAIRWVAAGT